MAEFIPIKIHMSISGQDQNVPMGVEEESLNVQMDVEESRHNVPMGVEERNQNVPMGVEERNINLRMGVDASPVATKRHDLLVNRDFNDQHPMSAITGLLAALNGKLNITDEIVIYCGDSVELVS